MPRKDKPVKYRFHKSNNQAFVEHKCQRYYLGRYGSPESHREYARVVQSILSTGELPSSELTINEVMLRYMDHVAVYYRKNGEPTSEQGNIKQALRFLRITHGFTIAREFGPRELKEVREAMVNKGRCRPLINKDVNRIRLMFRWATEEGLIDGNTYHSLQAVRPLKKNRCAAPEPPPVLSVPTEDVEATIPYLPPVIADMVRLQLLTGARPEEIRLIRPCEIDRSADVWEYCPNKHKTEHHDRERKIFLGPRAQSLLTPYLLRPAADYCFSPAESERKRNQLRRLNRKSTMTPSQLARQGDPTSGAGRFYSKDAYARAIKRACDKAKVRAWTPHRLRHTLATIVRSQFDLEAAQCVLGHSYADVTQIYAERDWQRARAVMAAIG